MTKKREQVNVVERLDFDSRSKDRSSCSEKRIHTDQMVVISMDPVCSITGTWNKNLDVTTSLKLDYILILTCDIELFVKIVHFAVKINIKSKAEICKQNKRHDSSASGIKPVWLLFRNVFLPVDAKVVLLRG